MPIFSMSFLLGDVFLQQFTRLPNLYWVIAACVALMLLRRFSNIFLGLACGFLWAYLYASYSISLNLPKELEGKTIVAKGYIASLPEIDTQQTAFLFSLNSLNEKTVKTVIHLSCRNCQEKFIPGDEWQFNVRLKRIHGMMNRGGFDYEAWALQEGIHATGYIVKDSEHKLLSQHSWRCLIDRFRQYLKDKITANLQVTQTSPWIYALSLGERQGISQDEWQVLRNTGTNHLMAIAGLHIGFMSAFIFTMVCWLWRRSSRFTLYLPAPHAGSIAALVMACVYGAMAGFSIPTQRACIMLSCFLLVLLLRRKINGWQAWSLALLVVLIINPLCVLTESFWLSFTAVAFIHYGISGRINPKGLWWKWGRIQWVITLALIPLSICLFQQCSLVSLIANSIAIPWVGFIIVPLTVIGSFAMIFSTKLGGFLLFLADKNLSYLWVVLTYLSHLPWAVWYQYIPDFWMLIAASISIVILLLPKGMPGRWFGLIWILPITLYKMVVPNIGDVNFTLLDVGQGLSTVIQTHHHVLVFDTGAHLNDNFDMGNSVVVPYLHTLAIKNIDMLVISHGDNDHIGGANAIIKQFYVKSIRTSNIAKFPMNTAEYCLRNQSWNWDGVQFQFLYPTQENLGKDNDSSCVLKVSTKNNSMLLTGDIEKYAEKQLLDLDTQSLKATILVAPHHGSKTSAKQEFIDAINPHYVLFPVGYRNRYHFPNAHVVEQYKLLHIPQFDTVHSGAINFYVFNNGNVTRPDEYRITHSRYWNDV